MIDINDKFIYFKPLAPIFQINCYYYFVVLIYLTYDKNKLFNLVKHELFKIVKWMFFLAF